MIPKKIHYCWLSGDAYPELVQKCMDSWHKHMPDWEYVLWDMDRIKNIDSVWLKECIETKKWAFAADFIRVYALYHEGGVYLDSDVMVYQTLCKFLDKDMFIGRENIKYPTFEDGVQVFLTSHCFGAKKEHAFLKLNLAYYQGRHFHACNGDIVPNELRYDMLMMPYIQSKLAEQWGYDPAEVAPPQQTLKHGIEVFPPYFFCWSPAFGEQIEHYATHLGLGSWREPEYVKKHMNIKQHRHYGLSYKIRWRMVVLLKRIAEKLDYKLERIHPDGWL